MGNLDLWNRHADIDPKFTKPITGKQYKGTSPNPQYVIQCLTDMFGPVGVGFGWDVLAEDFTPLGDEILHWCRIRFWHTERAHGWESYGQTKALMKTRNGPMLDEDAPKKSLTDAIIKAASHVGVASNIFLGRWDDQKYIAAVKAGFSDGEEPKPSGDDPPADIALKKKMLRGLSDRGAALAEHPKFKADLETLRGMNAEAAAEIDVRINQMKEAA